MVTGLHIGDATSNCFNNAGTFVTKDGRAFVWVLSFHEMEIGMTQPRGGNFDKHFTRAGLINRNLVDDELARNGFEDGSFHANCSNRTCVSQLFVRTICPNGDGAYETRTANSNITLRRAKSSENPPVQASQWRSQSRSTRGPVHRGAHRRDLLELSLQ
jgi:hypothetical protein